jgi:hypothetical protein
MSFFVRGRLPTSQTLRHNHDQPERLAHGELVSLELPPVGVSGLEGHYHTDPTLRESCAEAYRRRDTEFQA